MLLVWERTQDSSPRSESRRIFEEYMLSQGSSLSVKNKGKIIIYAVTRVKLSVKVSE